MMDDKTKYQMAMLAGAMKGGTAMYPMLRQVGGSFSREHGAKYMVLTVESTRTDWQVNPDLGALIEAANGQGLAVNFVVPGGVELRKGHWNSAADYTSRGPDNLSALIDALHQATEAENWEECANATFYDGEWECRRGVIYYEGESTGDACVVCHGTGKVKVPHEAP